MAGSFNNTNTDWERINKRKQINEDITSSIYLLSDEEKNLPEKEKELAIRAHFRFLQKWRAEELKPWEKSSLGDDKAMQDGEDVKRQEKMNQ